MYVCIYKYTHIYIYIPTNMHSCIQAGRQAGRQTHIHACVCMCVYIYIYIICIYLYTCIHKVNTGNRSENDIQGGVATVQYAVDAGYPLQTTVGSETKFHAPTRTRLCQKP